MDVHAAPASRRPPQRSPGVRSAAHSPVSQRRLSGALAGSAAKDVRLIYLSACENASLHARTGLQLIGWAQQHECYVGTIESFILACHLLGMRLCSGPPSRDRPRRSGMRLQRLRPLCRRSRWPLRRPSGSSCLPPAPRRCSAPSHSEGWGYGPGARLTPVGVPC